MTNTETTARNMAADGKTDPVPVPENPTQAELKDSLETAEFPRAAHMAKEIFGERPDANDDDMIEEE